MRFAMILALACISIPVAHAMESTDPGPITLDQVIVRVLEHNPRLGVHDYEAQAAAARIRQAAQSTPLELQLDLDNLAGSGDHSGVKRMETTLSLAKVLEPESAVSSRSDLARQRSRLLRNEQDRERLDLLAEATENFIHVVVDQHRLKLAEDQLALVRHTHEIVSQRVSAGKSHIAEQRRLAIDLARAEIELEHAEHELSTSRLKLATQWGATRPDFSRARADLFALPAVAPFARLETLLADNPDLVRFASEARIAQARVRLAQSRRTANLALAGGIRYLNAADDAALVFSLSMPLGARARAQAEIDEMQRLSEREPLRYQQRRLALYSSLYEIYQELLHARTAYEALSQRIIPAAQRAAADYEEGYRSGRFALLELNQIQATLLDARLEAVMTAANYHRLKIEIERLTGAALHSGEQP